MTTLVAALATVHLIISPEARAGALPLAEITAAVRAVWAPYAHVVISEPGAMALVGAQVLELRLSDHPPRAARDRSSTALAWVEFIDGEPEPVITISPARAQQVIANAMVMGRPTRAWPSALVRRMEGLALGRAIAHEIGHYLLRSTAHSPAGLMRPEFSGPDFFEQGTGRFRLTAAQADAVRARLAAPLRARGEPGPAGEPGPRVAVAEP